MITLRETRSTTRSWLIALFSIFGFIGFGVGSWISRLPSIRDELTLTLEQVSYISLSAAAGSCLGLLTATHVIVRLGARRSMAILLPTFAISFPLAFLLLLSGATWPAVVLLVIYGFAFCTADIAASVSGSDLERAAGVPRMARMHAGYSVGALLAIAIGAWAEYAGIGVVPHLAGAGAIALIGMLCGLRYIPRPAPLAIALPSALGHSSASSAWRDPRLVLIGLVTLIGALAEGSANTWLPIAFVDEHGLLNDQAVGMLALLMFITVAVRMVGDRLVQRFGRARVLGSTLLIGAVGIVCVALAQEPWLAVAGAVLWGIGAALGFPVGLSAAGDNPETAARDVATVSAIAYAAVLAGPLMIGLVGEQWGLRVAFLVMAVLVVGAAIASGAALRPFNRATETDSHRG